MLDGFDKSTFTALAGNTQVQHDVYTMGSQGPTVVIIQELPGIGQETLDLARRLATQDFRVVLPHLFGPLGRISMLGNLARVICMRREFRLLSRNASSPVVDWLRALCRDQLDNQGSTAVGVIGMCLTGNFAGFECQFLRHRIAVDLHGAAVAVEAIGSPLRHLEQTLGE